jgi:serine phosphatase RsbU (regulator of sigma subunit)/streptogramin lyase
VGTAGGGAFLFAPWRWKFRSYRHEIAEALGKPPHPMYAQVTALAEGEAGKVWVGTPSGLLSLDQFTDHWRVHRQGPGAEGEPPKESVSALVVDETGTLWIGTPGSGLSRLLPEGERRRAFRHEPGKVESLSSDAIRTLALGSKSTLWVGTQARGFNRLDLKSGRIERFPGIIPGLWQPGIWALLEDSRGYLWLGTPSFALHRFDPRSGEFVTYPWRAGDPKSLNNRTISSLFEDSQGRFWVGTFSGGLSLLNRESDTFKAFTIHQGLPSNMVQGILEDEGGDLWLATNGGIARFDPASGAVRAYDRRDGLQHDEFALGVVLKTGDGEVFLGGRGGLTRFRPADLADNPLAPPVILTSLRVLGEERRVGWDQSVPERVDFAHDENVLQIEFAALDYTDPQKNRYAWKLEGFDHRWVENIAGRVATYTNLDPGEYLFRVKGSNSDGVWSAEEASLRIRILPPFWRTWWFQTLEALGALGLLTLGFVWQRRLLDQQKRREIRRRDLQRKTEELEVARHLQLSMLPPPDFASANFEGVGRMVTATEVGGDYFDFLDLADGVSCLAIGDAIGHGTAAGLVVGMAKAALIQALALTQGVRPSPEELLLGLGKTLQKAVQGRTAGLGLCLVVLDDVTRSAEVCSVAMPYPYHYSAAEKRLRSLELGGFPLGRCGAEHLRSVRLELDPGDALILLSDGFPERLDPEDDQWGYEELNDVLAALCQDTTSPKDLTARLFAACDAFGQGREPEDDMTAVVVFCRG